MIFWLVVSVLGFAGSVFMLAEVGGAIWVVNLMIWSFSLIYSAGKMGEP